MVALIGAMPTEAKAQDVTDGATSEIVQDAVAEDSQVSDAPLDLVAGDAEDSASSYVVETTMDEPEYTPSVTDGSAADGATSEGAEDGGSDEQADNEAVQVSVEQNDTSIETSEPDAASASAAATQVVAQASVDEEQGAELPQGAASVEEGVYVFETNVADNKVLGVSDAVPAGHSAVTSVSYKGTNNQKWTVRKDEATGWYYILLTGTSEPLALGKARSSDRLELLYPDSVGDRALWAFVKTGSWFNLVNRSMPECLLAVSIGSKEENAALSFEDPTTTGAGRRFYLLDPNPQVKASDGSNEGAYEVAYNENTNIALDVKGGDKADNTNVLLYTYGGKSNQKVYLESDGKGFYTVWVLGTQKVLAQYNSSIIPGNNVVQKTYTAGNALQLWALHRNSDGSYSLVNKATGLALGATGNKSGSNLIGTRNDSYKTTRFKLVRQALLTAGIVEIHPRTTSQVTLDVKGAATGGSADLLLWKDGNKLNQRFELVAAGGTDLWRIRTASSGGWITVNNTGVQQVGKGSDAATSANTWRVTFKGGWYSLVNVATGKALDMRYGKTSNGTMIIAFTPNGKDSQHFSFNKVDMLAEGIYALQNGGSRYLDVKGASRNEGASIEVYQKTGGLNQMFAFIKNGSSWQIQSLKSGLYLTANSGSNGANVSQKSGGTNKTQLWTIGIADGGRIAIKSVANPKLSLNAANGGKKNCDNVNIATSSYAACQAWKPVTVLSDGTLTAKQAKVIASAKRTPSPGYGLCAGWVTNVFQNAGIGSWYGDACDQYRWFCKSADLTKLKPGMIIAVSSHDKTSAGRIWGHVGIYVGNGKLMDNVGRIRTISIFDWMDYYGGLVTPKWGWFGKSLV